MQKEADNLENEAVSLNMVKLGNQKAMKELDADGSTNRRFKKNKVSLADLKNELREKQEQLRLEEKKNKEEHAEIIEMEEK